MVALSYAPKVRGFMREIDQERYCLPIEDLTQDRLMSCVDETLSRYEERSKEIVESIERQRQRVRDAFDRWLGIVNHRRNRA